jgi:hypothetical protein
VIAEALVAPGHDGQAELVVRVRHENGVLGSVTLNAEAASRLLEQCGVDSAEGLRGQPWHRLLDVLRDASQDEEDEAEN